MAAIIQRSGPKQSRLIRDWTVTQVIIMLTWAPGLIAMLFWVHDDPLRDFRWFPGLSVQYIWFLISAVYLFRISDITTFELLPTVVPGLGVAIAGLALLGAWHLRKNRVSVSVIALALISLPLSILLISIWHVILIPRYFIWGTGPFFVLAGIGAAALPRQLFPLIVAALAVGGFANLAPYYRYETKPRWDLAAAYLAGKVQPGDVVITNGAMAHYVLGKYGARYHLDRDFLKIASDIRDVAQIAQKRRLWVIYGRTGQGISLAEESFLQKWSIFGAPALEERFGRQVVVWLFQPPAAVID